MAAEQFLGINTSYIICSVARSGSTLLCETLENSGIAGRPAEYFGKSRVEYNAARWHVPHREYIRKLKHECTTSNGVFGTKVLWGAFPDLVVRAGIEAQARPMSTTLDVSLKFGVELLRDSIARPWRLPGYRPRPLPDLLKQVFPNLHYVWVLRRDKVRQAVSHLIADQSRIWSSYVGGEQRPPHKDPEFNFEWIDDRIREIEDHEALWQRYFGECGLDPLTLVYEDFVQDPQAAAIEVLEYAGVRVPVNLEFAKGRLEKQSNARSDEWVQRYHVLKSGQIDGGNRKLG